MKLEKHETQTPLWMKIEEHLKARIETLRRMNDADLDPAKTARIRGRIAEARRLLSLAEDAPVTDD